MRGKVMAMDAIKRQAINDLADYMETFLENFTFDGRCPHLPPDVAGMMARQAFFVLETLWAGEVSLREDGELKESTD